MAAGYHVTKTSGVMQDAQRSGYTSFMKSKTVISPSWFGLAARTLKQDRIARELIQMIAKYCIRE